MTDLDRRTFVKGAAWSVPVIAAAIATPLAAASGEPPVQVRKRLTFNTKRTWDENINGVTPRIGVVVAAMDTTGPDAVGAVVIVVTIRDSAGVQQTASTTKMISGGWQATPDWTVHFDGVARGPYTVTLTATAQNVETISLVLNGNTVSQ